MTFLTVTILVILFASQSRGKENHQKDYSNIDDPPCFFNPLCICSKAFPDLGRVTCKDVPLVTIPKQISTSKIFMLHLENNGLRYLEPHIFQHTGLFRIDISQNFFIDIKKETFTGLELSLWELILQRNKFTYVPNQSIRILQKLKFLDLSGNDITNIRADDWVGLQYSLKTLILSGNKLSSLRPRTFSVLQQLESLDLSGNALFEFDVSVFMDGPLRLRELYLADNLLSSIPVQELSQLRELRDLDISFNQITEIQNLNHERGKVISVKLFLNTLRLDYNHIQYLPAGFFNSFSALNRTYLNGNPIRYIEKNAFQFSKVREIYFKDCKISDLSTDTFSGLQNFLEVLDLEGNNLTTLPLNFFKNFTVLKSLNLKKNVFKETEFAKIFEVYLPSLRHLDITNLQNVVDLGFLAMTPNLTSLALSQILQPSLASHEFPKFLTKLEEIKISYSNIKSLKSYSFQYFRGLRKLDLSENSISNLEDKAFSGIGHSLFYLSLANGLSSSMSQLPSKIFEDLTAVEFINISNNKLKVLSQKLFYTMKRLRMILIQDNFIEKMPKGMFQGDIHLELNTIQFSFNQLSIVESQSFTHLNKLEYIWLNDNKITSIEKGAFMNLPKLKYLNLQGNNIAFLKKEGFQDLPQLRKLDLAFNKIKNFNYDSLDKVGTLSAFSLNLSYNAIEQLFSNFSSVNHQIYSGLHINIKALDFSHNNISFIGSSFFKPIESSVTHVYLSYNNLRNITKNVFGKLMHLQWLDISHNFLTEIEHDAFTDTNNIQVLCLSNNHLQEIPKYLFKEFNRLRILNLATNALRSLPNKLLNSGKIEKLDVSQNKLTAFPISSFDGDSAYFLSELDLSDNEIAILPSPDAFAIFKNLYQLKLSKNRLTFIQDGTFSFLRRLHILDLSHNTDLNLESEGLIFHGLENVLEELILKNLSLNAVPLVRLSSLRFLDVSENSIFTIPYEISHTLSLLEKIELGDNKMVNVPPGINALTELQYLGLSRNPLESINFQQSFSLRELDLRNTSLKALEKGALGKLPLLKSFKISIHENTQSLNIPQLLKGNFGLNDLYIEDFESVDFLENKFNGTFPLKLQNLSLVGPGFKMIPRNLLEGIESSKLTLTIFNTSVQEIPEDVFNNGKKIRNLTLNVRSNKLKTMFNPNTGDSPNTPQKIFLLRLEIADNDWICDCSVGWIEVWERKKRQYLCEENSECFLVPADLRTVKCNNRKPSTLIEIFKHDLECGWDNSNNFKGSTGLIIFTMTLLWFFTL